jgi:hypothetical protein
LFCFSFSFEKNVFVTKCQKSTVQPNPCTVYSSTIDTNETQYELRVERFGPTVKSG